MRRAAVFFALAACSTFGASEATEPGGTPDAAADGAPSDGGGTLADGAPGPCPTGRGPAMVLVEVGTTRFCIDATEVTRAQYQAFLDSTPSTANQPAPCGFNKTYAPGFAVDMNASALPMVAVDWCDAYAYCAWAGKRLCGEIADGGPVATDAAGSALHSEWMAACSRGGTRAYPYGEASIDGGCNLGSSGAAAVATFPKCVGGYDGLFDMVGNVTEYENACNVESDGGAFCLNRGGSFRAPGGACYFASPGPRYEVSQDWGIRCCAAAR